VTQRNTAHASPAPAGARAWLLRLGVWASGLVAGASVAVGQTQAPATPAAPPAATPTEASAQALALRNPDALEAAIDPHSYILGPLDVLAVAIVVREMRTYELPVLPEGVVVVPNVGVLQADGITLEAFRTALRQAVARRYQNFELSCHLAQARQFRVYVTGEVKQPGTLTARPFERVSDLIERAGGFGDAASKRGIEVRDAAGTVLTHVDLAAFYATGDMTGNPHVAAGQVIVVPPPHAVVQVSGAVVLPGPYERRPGDTARDLIALAGGLLPQADVSELTIDTVDEAGVARVQRYDLNTADPPLDDAVRLAVLSTLIGKRRVYVILPDNTKHTLFLSEGETLANLVRRAGEVAPDVDFADATLATRGPNGETTHLNVDIARVLAGAGDRPLQDGDLLSISKMMSWVYVSGFVAQPGRFFYRADWKINDYVGAAGGTTSGGNIKKVVLISREGERSKVGRGEPVQGGDTIFVDRSTGGKWVIGLGLLTNVSALAISIVALTK
jgi:protein involved in polysaccharide export with SLBB domain